MRAFRALFAREVWSLAVSPFTYVLLAAWFFLNGVFFAYLLLTEPVKRDLDVLPQYMFGSGVLVWLLLPAFPPLLTLRMFAEEHRLGTLEPLLTAPVRDIEVVLAKFFAVCLFFLVFWAGVIALFAVLAWNGGSLDWSLVLSGFYGAVMISVLFLATGLWASAWGGNLLFAAAGGAAINFALLFVPVLFDRQGSSVQGIAHAMNIPDMVDRGFTVGLLDTYALAYFPLLAGLFLYLTWIRLVSRRWVP